MGLVLDLDCLLDVLFCGHLRQCHACQGLGNANDSLQLAHCDGTGGRSVLVVLPASHSTHINDSRHYSRHMPIASAHTHETCMP